MDSDLAWVNGKSGRQSWRYHADAFQRSIISEAIYHLYIYFYLDSIPIFRSLVPGSFVAIYADDILLIAPSCGEHQLLFKACESKLSSFDMSLNERNHVVLPGLRCDMMCANRAYVKWTCSSLGQRKIR